MTLKELDWVVDRDEFCITDIELLGIIGNLLLSQRDFESTISKKLRQLPTHNTWRYDWQQIEKVWVPDGNGKGRMKEIVYHHVYLPDKDSKARDILSRQVILYHYPELKQFDFGNGFYTDYWYIKTSACTIYITLEHVYEHNTEALIEDFNKGLKNQYDYCRKDSPLRKIEFKEFVKNVKKDPTVKAYIKAIGGSIRQVKTI